MGWLHEACTRYSLLGNQGDIASLWPGGGLVDLWSHVASFQLSWFTPTTCNFWTFVSFCRPCNFPSWWDPPPCPPTTTTQDFWTLSVFADLPTFQVSAKLAAEFILNGQTSRCSCPFHFHALAVWASLLVSNLDPKVSTETSRVCLYETLVSKFVSSVPARTRVKDAAVRVALLFHVSGEETNFTPC